MAKKSNKTAHVLSLLTNGRDIFDDDTPSPKKADTSEAESAASEQPKNSELPAAEAPAPKPEQESSEAKTEAVQPNIQTNENALAEQQLQTPQQTQTPQASQDLQSPAIQQTVQEPQTSQQAVQEVQTNQTVQTNETMQAQPSAAWNTNPMPTAAQPQTYSTQPVINPQISQVAQMAQIANLEAQVITPNMAQSIPAMFQAAPAVIHAAPAPKPEVVVEVQNSNVNNMLSDLVKADLERELNEQVRAQIEANARKKDYDENDRPPYSATFLAKFGDSLKMLQENGVAPMGVTAAHGSEHLAGELKLALEQNFLENNANAHIGFDDKENLPTSLDEVTTNLYVLENFDEDDSEENPENNIEGEESLEQEQGEDMEHEYSAKNNPTLSAENKSDDNKLVIRNLAEELVKAKATEIMTSMNMCTCKECFYDVVTYALNHLPPLYTATEKGQLFQKLASCELQYGTDIASEITKACITIKMNPRHELPDDTEQE